MKEPITKESLEDDLNKAIEASIASGPTINREPLPYWKNKNGADKGPGASRKAVDQLAQARDGLLKVEEELNQLLVMIAGKVEAEKPSGERDRSTPAEGLPMFDRVRQDATALAELAIRMHARIVHALERL